MKISTLFASLCLVIFLLATTTVSNPGIVFAQTFDTFSQFGETPDTDGTTGVPNEQPTTEEPITGVPVTEEPAPSGPSGAAGTSVGNRSTVEPTQNESAGMIRLGPFTNCYAPPCPGEECPLFDFQCSIILQNSPQLTDTLARSAGEIHREEMQKVLQLQQQAGGDRVQFLKLLLQELQNQGQITADERARLEQMVESVASAPTANARSAISSAEGVAQELEAENASPAAIVIAEIANDTLSNTESTTGGTTGSQESSINWGDIAGAIVGELCCPPFGGIIGGVLGSSSSAVAAPTSDELLTTPENGTTTPTGGGINATNATTTTGGTNNTNTTTTTPTTGGGGTGTTGGVTEPETGGVTEPETGGVTEPETGGVTEPET